MDPNTLIDGVIAREGDYSDHPADTGGPTRWGVTQAVARAHGYRGDMQHFPREEAVAIYRKTYWDQPGLPRIVAQMPRIAAEIFDTSVNMGPGTATGFLRRALNALNRRGRDYPDIPRTGVIDGAVAGALDSFVARRGAGAEAVLLKAIEALQGERYIRLAETRPTNEAFLYGWLANRIG